MSRIIFALTAWRRLPDYCPLMLMMLMLAFSAVAEAADEWNYHPGIRNSLERPLSPPQLQTLLGCLRRHTGLTELAVDSHGFLTAGDRSLAAGGSSTARALLLKALDGSVLFELENYYGSLEVAFAQLKPAQRMRHNQTRYEVGLIQLDFYDFAQMRGDQEAVAAFDSGISVLHELVHGVLNLSDAAGTRLRPGACEDYVNQMRRECGLPERLHYHPHLWQFTRQTKLMAMMYFARPGKFRQFQLQWEVTRVSNVIMINGERTVLIATVR